MHFYFHFLGLFVAQGLRSLSGLVSRGTGLRLISKALWSLLPFALLTKVAVAQQLILNPVAAPTVVGAGIGERALWRNAGTVGGVTVDIVGEMVFTGRDHVFATGNGQIQITSTGQDPHFMDFSLYEAGTHNISTNTGGVPVVADVFFQINDIDGPLNEQVYVNICDGTVEYVRVDRSATTYRGYIEGPDANLGTEVFYLAGDRNYSNQPVSGLEIFYPQTSTFRFGRTANNGFLVRLANPTYDEAQTYDLKCGDFKAPVLQDDIKEQVLSEPVVVNILFNDSVATENNNAPANNSGQPSEYSKQAIDLIPPTGAQNVVTDSEGHRVGFDVLGEGTWSYDDLTGELTFTPFVAFFAAPTPIGYRYQSPIILPNEPRAYSAPAQVSIDVGSVGLLKLAQLVDTNLNGYADPGETIAYVFTAENFGNVDLTNVQLAETQFSGKGVPPVITFQAATSLSPEGTLLVGEKAVYTATYTLVPEDLDTTISNQAEVTAETPGGTVVSDLSDSENPGDGDGVASNGPGEGRDDPTTIYAGSGPDRGDAPVTYGDPQHADTAQYWIGALNGDGDGSAQHSVDGTGDDLDGKDDEDEESFPQLYGDLTRTVTVVVNEPTPGTGYLQAFVDFGGDGLFLGDQVATDIQDGGAQDLDGMVNGEISFPVSVPVTAVLTPTFVRLRWSSTPGLDAITPAPDGEVEDYGITIRTPPDADRGDAPASYGDPQHIIEGPGAPEVYLGSTAPDIDLLAQNSIGATGDDTDGSDDEDGVTLPQFYRGGLAEITVAVSDLAGAPGSSYLQAFIDFDGDGTFNQAGEQVALNLQDGGLLDKDGLTNGAILFEVAVPAGATILPTYARFRWSTDSTGLATVFEGEVEDYTLTISSDPPPLVCDASLYAIVDSPSTLVRMTFRDSGGSYAATVEASGSTGQNRDGAWGYNALDGYIYGVDQNTRRLYRIDGAGDITDFGNIPGADDALNAGDILPNGRLIYEVDANTWQIVDLTNPAAPIVLGDIALTIGVNPEDLAFNPVDGIMYGIDRNSGFLFRAAVNNGTPGSVTPQAIGPAVYAGMFDALWFDRDGRLYGYSNTTNNLFVISTATGVPQLVSGIPFDEGGRSDGISCRGPAPIPLGGISGNIYEDADASDVKDNGETNFGAGVGISVFADNGTPANTADDIFLVTTDTLADGTYAVGDLMVNTTYRVALDEADPDLPSGLTIGTSNPLIGVPVSGNSVTSDQDFGFDPAGSDLELSKIAAATGTTTPITNVSEGDTIDWIITITNVSGGSPSGVKVIDQIPSGFAYVSDDAPATGDTYDPDTGLWFVDELLSGESETLTITTTVLGSGDFTNQAEIIYSSLPDPDSDPNTGPLTDDLFDQLPDDDEASYSVNLVTGERILTGRVFIDNGAGGGTAHDALRNGSEEGASSAVLEILDSGGAVLATPGLATDGTWSYGLSGAYSGSITIRAIPANNYRAISEAAAGLPDLVNANPHDGEFTFTPEAFGNRMGLDIGLLQLPSLTNDQTTTVAQGQVATLPHIYTATSEGQVTFSYAGATSTPTGAFSAALFQDIGCDDSVDGPITGPIAVTTGQTVCIVSRVSAGSGAGQGSTYVYQVLAATAFARTTVTSSASNTDEVSVGGQSTQIELRKTVENETQGTGEGTINLGGVNDILLYRIYLRNNATTQASNVKIYDMTPPYTELSEPIVDPQQVSPNLSCDLVRPASNLAGYAGAIEWNCAGQMLPGETGAVQFRVGIQ
ncbi:DUF11 domain-containing protein [Sulfitobacter dubius]|uniref:DUF11 domain-containing protein n=1 Tax=Sulfitobacter dubius TaxID=218673 RepID=UPI0022AEBAA1|nr:DUF11 domain-containing protein [Sulfitobacter dubius]MCZ4367337.1 GEVED domain-containing protein [Sulfitobacter dubius]